MLLPALKFLHPSSAIFLALTIFPNKKEHSRAISSLNGVLNCPVGSQVGSKWVRHEDDKIVCTSHLSCLEFNRRQKLVSAWCCLPSLSWIDQLNYCTAKTVPLQGTDGRRADHSHDRYDLRALPAVLAILNGLEAVSTLRQHRLILGKLVNTPWPT